MDISCPFVSIIIVNYNGWAHLQECLESVFRTVYPRFEVIVVDNGSTDGSTRKLAEKFPQVRILALAENFGFAEGNNLGAAVAGSEMLVFLNNDTVVEKEWLRELVKPMLNDARVAVCGSKVVFYSSPGIIDFAGGLISPIGAGINAGFGGADRGELQVRVSSHAYGAAMLIRRDVFREAGGFDRDYFAYHEELDLCWKCWLWGWKVLYVPGSVVRHKRSATSLSRGKPLKLYYAQKNQLRNVIKNFAFGNAVKGLAISFCFDLYRTVMFLWKGRFGELRAVWQADLEMAGELPALIGKRNAVQSRRVISDRRLQELGLIASLGRSMSIVFTRRGGFYLDE
jgi:GT2 family glycosyltransferase